jgi:hypothetical protein
MEVFVDGARRSLRMNVFFGEIDHLSWHEGKHSSSVLFFCEFLDPFFFVGLGLT